MFPGAPCSTTVSLGLGMLQPASVTTMKDGFVTCLFMSHLLFRVVSSDSSDLSLQIS